MTTLSDYTGPKITHQAVEYLPGTQTITRCWSKWEDGRITHQDSRSVPRQTADGFTVYWTEFVNIGRDEDLRPPAGLKWIDTRALAAEMASRR